MPGLAIVKTRHIAELRIYVERCIGWHNISNPQHCFPTEHEGHINANDHVRCPLTNFDVLLLSIKFTRM